MVRVSDYVVDKISEYGAKHIFLVTGRGILYLSDAVAKNEAVTGISMLHEQGASYAAMSYAKATNGIGACLVSTGCAATNAVTGALCAYQDNLPVVFISGQHMLNETTRHTRKNIRTFGSQEADIISVVQNITKYAVMIEDPKKTVYEVEKALYLACSGRKGPVWIDIPLDVQSVRIEPDELEHYIPEQVNNDIPDADIQYVINNIKNAKRPLLMVGGGASECKEEIANLVEKIKIPVVYSFSAADIYGSGNAMSIGAVGSLGAPRSGNFAFQNSDYLLVVGSKMCSQTVGGEPEKIARDARITVVDIDKDEHTKNEPKIDKLIIGDAKRFFSKLIRESNFTVDNAWVEKCLHWKKVFDISAESFISPDESGHMDLYCVCNRLERYLSEETAIITDAGLEELIVPSTIKYHGDQKCFFAAAQGAMGYAIPAIIGAYYGGYEDIVVVVGDGSIMMNIQELQLLKYLGINPKIFVINNNMYAVIRNRQRDLFRTRTIGNDETDGVPNPSFDKLAFAFDLDYSLIENEGALTEGLEKVFTSGKGQICEIMCKPEQRYFHSSFRKNEKGKLVRPSIEDMSPFMDRDLFISEMVVEPIEV